MRQRGKGKVRTVLRQDQQKRWKEHRSSFAYLALLLVAWAYFAWRIHASIAAGIVDNAVLGADAAEIFRALQDGRYHGLSLTKHPLAVIWAALTIAPQRLLGIDTIVAASLSFGLAAALIPTLTVLLVRLWRGGWLAAVAVAALATSGFATLTIISVVESYGITLAMIPATLIAQTLIVRHLPNYWSAGACAGIAAVFAAWANLPLAALVLAYPALQLAEGRDDVRSARSLLLPLAVAGLGAVAPTIALGLLIGFGLQQSTIDQWTSLSHFTDRAILTDYFASALAFGAVSPDTAMQCRYPAAAMATLLSDPLRLVALVFFWLLIVGGVAIGLRDPARRPVTAALLITIAIWLIFFLWFAPFAALLFAGQWWMLLALLALPLLARSRSAAYFSIMLALLLALLNAPILPNSPIDDFAASCPPELQVNGGI
jgi:hypothetical protein